MKVTVGDLSDSIEFDNPEARIISESFSVANPDESQTTIYEYDERTGTEINHEWVALVPVLPEKQSILPIRIARLSKVAIQTAFSSIIEWKNK